MNDRKKEFYRNIYSKKKFNINDKGDDDDDDYDEDLGSLGIELDFAIDPEYDDEYSFEVLSADEVVQYMLDTVKEVSSVIEVNY